MAQHRAVGRQQTQRENTVPAARRNTPLRAGERVAQRVEQCGGIGGQSQHRGKSARAVAKRGS